MNGADSPLPVTVSTATRTLLAAGYEVTGCQRHPQYAEIQCERISKLGPVLRYTFAITTMMASQVNKLKTSKE